jgi:ABC-2 type transport system permease protein
VDTLSTIYGIVARDLCRAVRQKSRLVGGLARPFMWLLLVGSGYNAIARVEGVGSYYAFVYPGLIVMAALFGAMLTAISTVYDREFGMLRLMLASPAGIPAVLAGRALAALLVGMLQGGIVLLCIPFILSVTFTGIAAAVGVLALGAAVSSVLGLLVAAPLRSVENFAGVINVVLFPLLFLSGALYPTAGMPLWARSAARLNPVTYVVDLMRGALDLPTEFSVMRSLLVLGVSIVLAFALTILLFNPEQRFVLRRPQHALGRSKGVSGAR